MSNRRALITGITGQDGSYLAELLLDKGYEVFGVVRRSSAPNLWRIEHILDRIQLKPGDCAPRSVMLMSPWFKKFDVGVEKKVQLGGTWNAAVRFDMLNVFDNPLIVMVRSAMPSMAAIGTCSRPS